MEITSIALKKVKTININLGYMADSFAAKIDNIHSFKEFLLEYLGRTIKDADGYDNWNDIRMIIYNDLFVYCAERDYDDVLQKLRQIKYK
jgi:hypothetical protein